MKKRALQRVRSEARSDAEAMTALARGELSALGELYDAHHHAVRQFLRRLTGERDEADDLTHEAFLTAARIAASYDGRESARPFLIGIAIQLARRGRQRPRRWQALIAGVGSWLAPSPRTPEEDAGSNETFALFEAALLRLSEEKRAVLLLVEREGFSSEEAAAALDIPVGTVWTRLHHARAELRRALARKGAVDDG